MTTAPVRGWDSLVASGAVFAPTHDAAEHRPLALVTPADHAALLRIPPHNFGAEQAVLGAILLEGRDTFPRVAGTLGVTDFHIDRHREIFKAMGALRARQEPIDLLTLHDELRRTDPLEFAGGPAALALLMERASILVNLSSYVRLVKEEALRREFLQLAERLRGGVMNGATATELSMWTGELLAQHRARDAANGAGPAISDYIEPIAVFLAEEDPPVSVVFPDLLPCGVIMLLHGEPRARKSLAAFELALAAATGTAPFGLKRFQPAAPISVLYIQEEDPRSLTRPRLRRIVHERCGGSPPTTLRVAVRRSIDLDDAFWVARIVEDLKRLDVRLLILDAARRLSIKTDEGPAKVRELIAVLRSIVTLAEVTLVVVHHDIKPAATGQDLRRRGQRASGGDWFAGCECPVHVERVGDGESLVYPQDYKFSVDPAPFTFTCAMDGKLVRGLIGRDTTTAHAETAGVRGTLMAWLRAHGPASKTALKKAGFGWETVGAALDALLKEGMVDAMPGRTAGSSRYFAKPLEPSSGSQDGSPPGRFDAA